MSRPYHYHAYHRSGFDALPAWSSLEIQVRDVLTGRARERMTVYSLQKDMDQLRADGAAKGIVDAGLRTVGSSARGKQLWVLKVGNGASHPVLFTGCHHAREWISVEMPYLVAEYLIQKYNANPTNPQEKRIKHLLLNRQIWFIPLVNPDGHDHTMSAGPPGPDGFSRRWWRPNRNSHAVPAGTAARSAANGGDKTWPAGTYTGVDINRNYATANWGTETFKDGSVRTSRDPRDGGTSSIWCGLSGSGEAESAIIDQLIRANNFRASITYHSFSEDLLFPDASATDDFVQWVGNGMTGLISASGDSYQFLSGSGMYPTSGDLMEFTYDNVPPGRRPGAPGRPTYTPEVRPFGNRSTDPRFDPTIEEGQPIPRAHAFSGLPENLIEATFKENLGAALALINCAGHDARAAAHSLSLATASPPAKGQMVRHCWQVFRGWVP